MLRPAPASLTSPDEESVWNYPRPPRVEAVTDRLRVIFDGAVIAETVSGWRVLETSHPPTYYFPPGDVASHVLMPEQDHSYCEWKGEAIYLIVVGASRRAARAAWTYPNPTPPFRTVAGFVAFYAAPMDACFVGDEEVTPQPGGFYGGWITRDIFGPFKGEPGSGGW